MLRMPVSSWLLGAWRPGLTGLAGAAVVAVLLGPAAAAPQSGPSRYPVGVVAAGVRGGDISWPNCPRGMGVAGRRTQGLPLPTADAAFFIIGLTNGRAFTRNPCLSDHVAAAQVRGVRASAYTMLSYPNAAERVRYGASGPFGTATYESRIANVGYAQAAYALDTMAGVGLNSPFVWIDVEPRAERPWSQVKSYNRALIGGAVRAASDRGISSGIYTYASFWGPVTANWQLALPLWAPGHSRSRTFAGRAAQTIASCARKSFTGGPLVITQWVWAGRDHDVTCPAIATSALAYWVDFGYQAGTAPTPGTSAPSSAAPTASPSSSSGSSPAVMGGLGQ